MLSDRIKTLRKERGWYQKELADRLEVSRVTVSKWEAGERSPSSLQRKKLCDLFNITEVELFGGVTKEASHIIKITGKAKAGGLTTILKHEQEVALPDHASVKNCEGVKVVGDSMQPLARDGNILLYNKDCDCLECEDYKQGELVYIKLYSDGAFFKKIYSLLAEKYPNFTTEMKKINLDYRKKQGIKGIYLLESINTIEPPIICRVTDIEFCYKVVGIIF